MRVKHSFDVEKWSERLNLPYVSRIWFNYNFGGGWGDRDHGSKEYSTRVGNVFNVECKRLNQRMNMVLNSLIEGKWENCCSLYAGIIAFCLKYCKDDITYYKDNRPKHHISVNKCCEELKFPTWCRPKLEKIFKMDISLEDYLHSYDEVKRVNFDIDSALMVHKLQGDDAIFSILSQLFFIYKYSYGTSANLVPELPIIWTPEVSDFVTGTSFPVVASKFSNNFEWRYINSGFFLFDEFDNPIDCASVGFFNVFNESLGNRLSFCSATGKLPDYVICWCWKDLVDAVGHYNGDILVRNLSGGYNGWFRFGLGGKLAVWTERGDIYCKKPSRKIPGVKTDWYPGEKRWLAIVNLAGQRVDDKLDEKVIWNWEEMCDWFELGKMCKEALHK